MSGKLRGTYRHYKNNFYNLIALARTEDTNEIVVVYQRVEGGVTEIREGTHVLAVHTETEQQYEVVNPNRIFIGISEPSEFMTLRAVPHDKEWEDANRGTFDTIWLRPYKMFFGMIDNAGDLVQRFRRVKEGDEIVRADNAQQEGQV